MIPKNVDATFADRLQRILDKKDMSRADLARAVWGEMVDERGYTVAKNRQQLSKYLNGKAYPSDATKTRICRALDVPFKELFPADESVNRPGSGITMEQVNKKECRLHLDLVLPITEALKVIQIASRYAT